jgi:hypothetical protein
MRGATRPARTTTPSALAAPAVVRSRAGERYDQKQISYGKLLQIYFSVATIRPRSTVNIQFRAAVPLGGVLPDGPAAAGWRGNASPSSMQPKVFPGKIATRSALTAFYAAEAYHQDYATHNPTSPRIAVRSAQDREPGKRLVRRTTAQLRCWSGQPPARLKPAASAGRATASSARHRFPGHRRRHRGCVDRLRLAPHASVTVLERETSRLPLDRPPAALFMKLRHAAGAAP